METVDVPSPASPSPALAADETAIVCRYGEMFLKCGNRNRFERALADSARRALAGLPGARVETPHGRLLARVSEPLAEEATQRLTRVFGLVSVSPASCVAADIEAIAAAAIRQTRAAVARDPALARSFKVEARRSDKRFPLKSYDIAREVGVRVWDATHIPVDLEHPALTIGVEIRATAAKGAFVYADVRPGPGGLPAGTAGRGLLLLSGGIDSPVAAWLSAKRGLALDGVYFHSPPFVGEKTKEKILALARVLHEWQALRSVTVVNFTDVQRKLREHGRPELAVVLYRRMMMRIADRIAGRLGAEALVTGENLGQVASQTLRNLTTIDRAARRLVLRPLLTYDKVDTIAIARRIGTFELSTLPFEDCCSLFVPDHPATGARPQDAERSEEGLDVEALADEAAAAAERIDLSTIDAPAAAVDLAAREG